MVTKSNEKIMRIKPEGNIHQCPACGYNDGFHVSFQMLGGRKQAEIILICPNCHQRFQIGWQTLID